MVLGSKKQKPLKLVLKYKKHLCYTICFMVKRELYSGGI